MRNNIFITGAEGGFGQAVARKFGAAGYFVGLTGLDGAALDRLADELGGPEHAYAHVLDVTDVAQAQAAVEGFAAASGNGVQVLFNNAGIMPVGAFGELDIATERKVIDINLFGVMNVAYAALPYLKATTGAHIINVSSASAIHGNPELVAYSASKRAVMSFSESLDISLRGTGIAVSDILPMYAKTSLVSNVESALRKAPSINITAEDIADTVWRVVRTKRFRSYVGADTKVFARLGRIAPYGIRKWLTRRVLGW